MLNVANSSLFLKKFLLFVYFRMNKINDFASRVGKAPKGAGIGVAALIAGAGLFYGASNSLFTGINLVN